jgi:hypothetical protein
MCRHPQTQTRQGQATDKNSIGGPRWIPTFKRLDRKKQIALFLDRRSRLGASVGDDKTPLTEVVPKPSAFRGGVARIQVSGGWGYAARKPRCPQEIPRARV